MKQSDLLGLSGVDEGLPLVQRVRRQQAERNARQASGAVEPPAMPADVEGNAMARETQAEQEAAAATAPPRKTPAVKKTAEDSEHQETLRLLRRAQEGDEKTRPQIKEWLEARAPGGLQPVPDFARDALLRSMSGKSILLEEDARQQMKALHVRLAGKSPSPLETLLVERIVTCWLHLHYYETLAAQSLKDQSLRQSEAHGKRIEQAHRRYLSAIKALAQVRRLELPAVQVNIGQHQNIAEKQINVSPNTVSTNNVSTNADGGTA